eukprot:COSAG05_NODE_214_length_13907_cov_28.992178_23_plen_90_part_00
MAYRNQRSLDRSESKLTFFLPSCSRMRCSTVRAPATLVLTAGRRRRPPPPWPRSHCPGEDMLEEEREGRSWREGSTRSRPLCTQKPITP